jgi:hypothetical protein
MVTPEPKISLLEKFDGTRSKFQGFVSQVCLIMQLHPRRYFDDTIRVGFIGTLLTGTTAAWFAPILETSSPLLQDFNAFMAEFEAAIELLRIFKSSPSMSTQPTTKAPNQNQHLLNFPRSTRTLLMFLKRIMLISSLNIVHMTARLI